MIYSFPSFESPITFLTQSPVVDVIAIGLLNGTIILYNIKLDESIMSLKQEGCVTSISFRTGNFEKIIIICIINNVILSVSFSN